MSIIKAYSRLQHHRLTGAGLTFSVPTQEDFTIPGAWTANDLANGEIGINITDQRFYYRTDNTINEVLNVNNIGAGLTYSGGILINTGGGGGTGSGTSGVNGTSGTSGVGSSGTSGTSGVNGSAGVSGTGGSSGTSGLDGTSGVNGVNGSNGTTGTSGFSGTSGTSATSGSAGTSGTRGTSGSSGSSGTNGAVIGFQWQYSSATTGNPASGYFRFNGDKDVATIMVINQTSYNGGLLPILNILNSNSVVSLFTQTGQFGYTLKVNSVSVSSGIWTINYSMITNGVNFNNNDIITFVFNIPGTSGTAGVNGLNGTSGINGTAGTSGNAGVNGTAGTSGANGLNGTSGINGTGGTSGINGTSGVNGANGTSGINGTGGTSGANGANGTSGSSGVNGTNGVSGTAGTSGAVGANGTAGTSGNAGVNGTSGTAGTRGTSGTSGNAGVNGTSGTAGVNGTAGTSGAVGLSGTAGTSGAVGANGTSGTAGTRGTSGTSGSIGANGSAGTSGLNGTNGNDGASTFRFNLSGIGSGNDPGTGAFTIDAPTQATASLVYVSRYDIYGNDIQSWITSLMSNYSNNTVYMQINQAGTSNQSLYEVTGYGAYSGGSWFSMDVSLLGGAATYSVGSVFSIGMIRDGGPVNLNNTLALGNTGSVPIQLANGSFTSPSYTFQSSTDTGLFYGFQHPTSDLLYVSVNSATAAHFRNDGTTTYTKINGELQANISTGDILLNGSVTGTFTQSLGSYNNYAYTLTGNTTFGYLFAKNTVYNFLIKAGSFTFNLSAGSNWQTVGGTSLGLTGSFIMSAMYDGTDMWVSTVKNYSGY